VASFLPDRGRCRFCSTGHQNLCDLGALIMAGTQADGTHRRRARGQNVGVMAFVGTFSQYGTVPEASIVKIDDDLPLSRACLLGCGVTGWGSAVNTADVSPGDTVVVIGLGGIGSGAVQGARLRPGIIIVDPMEAKREGLRVRRHPLRHVHAGGHGAGRRPDQGRDGRFIDPDGRPARGRDARGRREPRPQGRRSGDDRPGPDGRLEPTLNMMMFTLFQKRLLGSLYGEANPRADIPRLLSLYREGKLLLDETVTHEYKLAEVNEGYEDMRAGKNIRGVVLHDH
jgi:S-(hydroxymethyl)glutathione dehydrogenase/alcohol dehydrogenase